MEARINEARINEARVNEIFKRHINKKPPVQYSSDRLLKDFEFYESKHFIAARIFKIWNDIFELYGWEVTRNRQGRQARQINLFHRQKLIAVEVQNNWKTLNYDCKQSKFKTLKEYKIYHPNYEVIFGCINDFKERNYYNKDKVRVLTGDLFLEYMLGKDWKIIESILKDLMHGYISSTISTISTISYLGDHGAK